MSGLGFAGRHVGWPAGVQFYFCRRCSNDLSCARPAHGECILTACTGLVQGMYRACTYTTYIPTPTSLLPVHECTRTCTRTCNTCLAAYLPPSIPYLSGCLPIATLPIPPFPPCSANQAAHRHAAHPKSNRVIQGRLATLCAPSHPPIFSNGLAQGGKSLLSIIRGSTCIVRGTYANDSMSQASRTILSP